MSNTSLELKPFQLVRPFMSRHPYPMQSPPPTRTAGGSTVITIPKDIVAALDIEAGEAPTWKWDADSREVVLSFE